MRGVRRRARTGGHPEASSGHRADRPSRTLSSRPSPRRRRHRCPRTGHGDTAGVGTTGVPPTVGLRRAGRRGHVPLSGGFGRRCGSPGLWCCGCFAGSRGIWRFLRGCGDFVVAAPCAGLLGGPEGLSSLHQRWGHNDISLTSGHGCDSRNAGSSHREGLHSHQTKSALVVPGLCSPVPCSGDGGPVLFRCLTPSSLPPLAQWVLNSLQQEQEMEICVLFHPPLPKTCVVWGAMLPKGDQRRECPPSWQLQAVKKCRTRW